MNPIETYLGDLDAFFDGENHWQAGLFQLISELTLEQALFRPTVERHCIWEVLRHINFWKMYAIAYLNDETRPDANSGNWGSLPDSPDYEKWKQEIDRTKALHYKIKEIVKNLGDNLFDSKERKSNYIR